MTELVRFGSRLGDDLPRGHRGQPRRRYPRAPRMPFITIPAILPCISPASRGLSDPARRLYRLARPVVPRAELDQLSPTGIQLLSACWPGPARDSLISRINSLIA